MQKKIRKYSLIIFGGILVFIIGLVFTVNNYASSQEPVISPEPELLMDRANYLDYSDKNLAVSRKLGRTVLFFAANDWCSTCARFDKELKQKSNLLPTDVTVLKVDYDNNSQMKNNYLVVIQHTIVVLDRGGNEVTRWVGGDLKGMINRLQHITS